MSDAMSEGIRDEIRAKRLRREFRMPLGSGAHAMGLEKERGALFATAQAFLEG